jgi:hypothetical protein
VSRGSQIAEAAEVPRKNDTSRTRAYRKVLVEPLKAGQNAIAHDFLQSLLVRPWSAWRLRRATCRADRQSGLMPDEAY